MATSTSHPDDGLYPMRVVARLTGLSPDVVRVWQRRYGAVTPVRTDGNARRFTAADVRRLSLLKRVVEQGHAIGDVAGLDDRALEGLADTAGGPPPGAPEGSGAGLLPQRLVATYLASIERFDATAASDQLALAATLMRPRELILDLILPLLREVGARWHAGLLGVVEEHLVSGHVRGVLDALVRSARIDRGAERVLVTTPEGHLHELGALVGALLAASRGFDVLYLGPATPERELERAAVESGAAFVLLGVVWIPPAAEVLRLAGRLTALAARVETWVGLPDGHPLVPRLPGLRLFHGFEELDAALAARAR